MRINKTYSFRAYPNETQKQLLEKTFGCTRFYWNYLVSVFLSYKKEDENYPKYKDLKELKEEYDWLSEVSQGALQQKYRDFMTYQNQFFSKTRKSKISFPTFKKKGSNQSYRLPNQKIKIFNDCINLEKIGKVKVVYDRFIPKEAKVLSATISKTNTNKYFIKVLCEQDLIFEDIATDKKVGIDLGVTNLLTLSDGIIIENKRFLRENQSKIQSLQVILSKKKQGSSRYKKIKHKIALEHEKIKNKRKDYLHNITKQICLDYDFICIEDLDVQGLMKNRIMSHSISDVSFSLFRKILTYKAKWNNKKLYVVGRFEPTSKKCSQCGNVKEKIPTWQRIYTCKSCGVKINRDVNAAKNILALGIDNALRTQ